MAESLRHSELVRVSYILAKQNLDGYTLDGIAGNNYYYDLMMKHHTAYGSGLTLLGNEANIGPHHIHWPVPDEVILANTLGVINQNEGYIGAERNEPPIEVVD